MVQSIKTLAKDIPCLSLVDEKVELIVEIDASNLGYDDILKQKINDKETIVYYHQESGIVLRKIIPP